MGLTPEQRRIFQSLAQAGYTREEAEKYYVSYVNQQQAKSMLSFNTDGTAIKNSEGHPVGESPQERRLRKKADAMGLEIKPKSFGEAFSDIRSQQKEQLAEKEGREEDIMEARKTGEMGLLEATVRRAGLGAGKAGDFVMSTLGAATGAAINQAGRLVPQKVKDLASGASKKVGEGAERVYDEIAEFRAEREDAPTTKEQIKQRDIEMVKSVNEAIPQPVKDVVEGVLNIATPLSDIAGAGAVGQVIKKGGATVFKKLVDYKNVPKEQVALQLKKDIDADIISAVEAEKVATKYNIELPASSTSKPVWSKLEQILGEGLFGGRIRQRAETAINKFDDLMQRLQGAAKNQEELGRQVTKNLKDVEDRYRQVNNALYGAAEDLQKQGDIMIKMPQERHSVSYLDEVIARKNTAAEGGVNVASDVKQLQAFRQGLSNTDDMAVWRATLQEVGDRANFNKLPKDRTPEDKMYGALYNRMKADIDDGISESLPQLRETLDVANDKFQEMKFVQNKPLISKIKRLEEQEDYTAIAKEVTKPNMSPEDVRLVYELVGDQTKRDIQERIFADMITKAKSASGEGYTASGLSKQIKSIGDENLDELLGVEKANLVRDMNTLNQAIQRATAVSRGSQTAVIQQIIGIGKGIAALSTSGLSLLAEAGLARYIASKAGQKWLKGLKPRDFQRVQEVLKTVGRQSIVSAQKRLTTPQELQKEIERISTIKKETLQGIADTKLRRQVEEDFNKTINQLRLPAPKEGTPISSGTIDLQPINLYEDIEKTRGGGILEKQKAATSQSEAITSTKAQNSATIGDDISKTKMTNDYRIAHQIDDVESISASSVDIDAAVKYHKTQNGYLTKYDQQDLNKLKKMQGNPDMEVKIYRAAPKNELNDGDWVTTSRQYAVDIKNQNGGKVYTHTVKAGDLLYPKNMDELPSLARFSAFKYKPSKMTAPKELIEEAKKYKSADEFIREQGDIIDQLNTLRQKRHKLHSRQDIDTAESQIEELANIIEDISKKTGVAKDEASAVKNLNKKIESTMMDDEYFDFDSASLTKEGENQLDEFIEDMNNAVESYMREFESSTGIKDLAPSGIARNREFGGQANHVSRGNMTIDEWFTDIWKQANQ